MPRGTRELLGQDIIDSRDIIERIKYLEIDEGEEQDEDEAQELAALRELENAGIEDWHHGATLILDSHFEDYARQLAEDVGAIESDARWPATCIDWEQAAAELQHDYSAVEAGGYTYWVR